MKSFVLSLLFSFSFLFLNAQAPVSPVKVWSTDTLLRTPESVFYHKAKNVLYVTNINSVHPKEDDNDGFISIVSMEGKIINLKWITGFNDPKGMAEYKGRLYVGDLKNLVEIDIEKGEIIKKYTAEGTQFFNDVAVDKDGIVYVNDSYANKVFRLVNGNLELWMEGEDLKKPNGLYISSKIALLAKMNEGAVYKMDLTNKKLIKWAENLPSADGIASDGKGNFFVSNWNGEVYFVNKEGNSWKILDTKAVKLNCADIEYLEKSSILLVPTFFGNQVSAYKIN